MKDTLVFLLSRIVDHPDDVVVDESVVEDLPAQAGKTILTIHANQEDLGKIIGKSGRIIRSLRDLIKLMAAKTGVYVDVVIAEETPVV
jgi:predicted RNA-binding protein YlqC (UPF0109 family)